jgi:hypothetical protein
MKTTFPAGKVVFISSYAAYCPGGNKMLTVAPGRRASKRNEPARTPVRALLPHRGTRGILFGPSALFLACHQVPVHGRAGPDKVPSSGNLHNSMKGKGMIEPSLNVARITAAIVILINIDVVLSALLTAGYGLTAAVTAAGTLGLVTAEIAARFMPGNDAGLPPALPG